MATFFNDIKTQIQQGAQYHNEAADWWTIFRPSENFFMICVRGEDKFYKNLDSAARRTAQLLKRGY